MLVIMHRVKLQNNSILILKPRRLRLELKLLRVVPNDADLPLGEALGSLTLDLQSELDLRAVRPLQLHDHRIEDRVE